MKLKTKDRPKAVYVTFRDDRGKRKSITKTVYGASKERLAEVLERAIAASEQQQPAPVSS